MIQLGILAGGVGIWRGGVGYDILCDTCKVFIKRRVEAEVRDSPTSRVVPRPITQSSFAESEHSPILPVFTISQRGDSPVLEQ